MTSDKKRFEDYPVGKPVSKYILSLIHGSFVSKHTPKVPYSVHPVALLLKALKGNIDLQELGDSEAKECERCQTNTNIQRAKDAKTTRGARTALARSERELRREIELIKSEYVWRMLQLNNKSSLSRFIKLSQYQWGVHLYTKALHQLSGSLTSEEAKGRTKDFPELMFFACNRVNYKRTCEFDLDTSKKVLKNIGHSTKEMKSHFKQNYVVCGDCNCILHRSFVDAYASQYPLCVTNGIDPDEDEGSLLKCLDCYDLAPSPTPLSKTYESFRKTGHAPILPMEASSNIQKKKKKKRTQKLKKKARQIEAAKAKPVGIEGGTDNVDNVSQSKPQKMLVLETSTADDGGLATVDGMASTPTATKGESRETNTASPTAVVMTNDDWVDFLQQSGSIIALNEYMDSILGDEDDMITKHYDLGAAEGIVTVLD